MSYRIGVAPLPRKDWMDDYVGSVADVDAVVERWLGSSIGFPLHLIDHDADEQILATLKSKLAEYCYDA